MAEVVKVVVISDIHGYLPDLPDGDILLIAGDICPAHNHSIGFQLNWLETNFNFWLRKLKYKNIVLTPGNHDFCFQEQIKEVLAIKLPCKILIDDYAEIQGFKIYGSPWQPVFFDWAFNATEDQLEKIWEKIPNNTDILLLHGPPFGVGDLTPRGVNTGSPSLMKKIEEVKPKLAVWGHIHHSYGQYQIGETIGVNASYVNEKYKPANLPIIIELKHNQ